MSRDEESPPGFVDSCENFFGLATSRSQEHKGSARVSVSVRAAVRSGAVGGEK
jgi:hypothetical protein